MIRSQTSCDFEDDATYVLPVYFVGDQQKLAETLALEAFVDVALVSFVIMNTRMPQDIMLRENDERRSDCTWL